MSMPISPADRELCTTGQGFASLRQEPQGLAQRVWSVKGPVRHTRGVHAE